MKPHRPPDRREVGAGAGVSFISFSTSVNHGLFCHVGTLKPNETELFPHSTLLFNPPFTVFDSFDVSWIKKKEKLLFKISDLLYLVDACEEMAPPCV